MVKWFNTAVCKTATRGFESHSDLWKNQSKLLWVGFFYKTREWDSKAGGDVRNEVTHRQGQARAP